MIHIENIKHYDLVGEKTYCGKLVAAVDTISPREYTNRQCEATKATTDDIIDGPLDSAVPGVCKHCVRLHGL